MLVPQIMFRFAAAYCAPLPMGMFHGEFEAKGQRYLSRVPDEGVYVAVGGAAGVGVRVGVDVAVLVGVAVGATAVDVGVRVGVIVGVIVGVRVGVAVGVTTTGVDVRVGVGVGVDVRVAVAVGGITTGVGVCVAVGGTAVELGVPGDTGVGVDVAGGCVYVAVAVAGTEVAVAGSSEPTTVSPEASTSDPVCGYTIAYTVCSPPPSVPLLRVCPSSPKSEYGSLFSTVYNTPLTRNSTRTSPGATVSASSVKLEGGSPVVTNSTFVTGVTPSLPGMPIVAEAVA